MLRSTRYFSAHFKRSLLVGGAVAAMALGTFALAAPDSGAATRPMTVPGNTAPQIPAGSARLGTLAAGQKVSVTVTLNLRNQAQLNALLSGQADPSSPYYGRYLSAAQFDARFGPTADQVTQVENALRAAGLTPGQASADRLSIPVTGTAAQVERAFGTTLATYRLPGGRVAFANTSAPQVQDQGHHQGPGADGGAGRPARVRGWRRRAGGDRGSGGGAAGLPGRGQLRVPDVQRVLRPPLRPEPAVQPG
jgi:hypothetical protein